MSSSSLQLLMGIGTSISQFGQGQIAKQSFKVSEKELDLRAAQTLEAYQIQNLREQGSVRASYARSGVDPNRGSPADVAAEMAYWQELDAQRAYYNAKRQAQSARRQAKAAEMEGTLAMTSSFLDVIGRGLAVAQQKGTGGAPLFELNTFDSNQVYGDDPGGIA